MDISANGCLCGNPFDPEQFMIQCDICKIWCHGMCVAVKEYMATEIDKFHCPQCQNEYGPSIMREKVNHHRHDYSEKEADAKPVQTGTPVFIRELKSRHFPQANNNIKYLDGQELTFSYLQANGFDIPIIVNNKESLDMVLPSPNFSLHDIASYIGGDHEMDVIDVAKQNNVRMKLSDFIEYYNDPYRSRILNVISLEFTNTKLAPLVEAPLIARKLDWVNNIWPQDWPADSELKKPEVQKYCLIGVKDSFTDFHIDFGGTSVWYHVLRGEKVFYLIKPTQANLHLYQQWMCSSTQSETFFGDQVDSCYKCVIKQGQTMMIPTGWIHAVLTPVDSLVFGGNFVHSLNIPMQLQIYEMEKKMKTPAKFQYPGFETINWFAAKCLLKELKDQNSKGKKCLPYFLQGLKALLSMLKQWNTDKDYNMLSRSQIPVTINSQKLLRDLSKEIRCAERFLISTNPPKPERESKRKKTKTCNKDFLDLTAIRAESEKLKKAKITTEQSVKNILVATDAPVLNSFVQSSIIDKKQETPPFPTSITTLNKVNTKTKKSRVIEKSKSKKTLNTNLHDKKLVKNDQAKSKKISKFRKPNPTLIRFKLGDKEVVRSTKDTEDSVYGNFKFDDTIKTRKELTWKQTTSVYDFHDGSNDSDNEAFTIVEAPKKKKTNTSSTTKQYLYGQKLEESTDMPKNGIEELLKASAYTSVADPKLNVISDRASPSTRDAIAGMLSISVQGYTGDPQTTAKSTEIATLSNSTEKKSEKDDDEDELSIENINKVHQDDDFIYPALDVSDDDEFSFKLKKKKEDDEAWNPKAKVGPLLPKTNRPTRDGAKKAFVEKGLEAAAKKQSKQSVLNKRSGKVGKQKSSTSAKKEPVVSKPITESVSDTPIKMSESIIKTKNFDQIHTYSTVLTNSNRLEDVKAKLAAPVSIERKPRKGMKTAKQRLGKILKIHKMLH